MIVLKKNDIRKYTYSDECLIFGADHIHQEKYKESLYIPLHFNRNIE